MNLFEAWNAFVYYVKVALRWLGLPAGRKTSVDAE